MSSSERRLSAISGIFPRSHGVIKSVVSGKITSYNHSHGVITSPLNGVCLSGMVVFCYNYRAKFSERCVSLNNTDVPQ